MSGTAQPEPGGVDWDKIITLDQFVAAAQRHRDWHPPLASSWGHQTVIVHAITGEVLASFDDLETATRDFYARIDEDPRVVGCLRLAHVSPTNGVHTWWPSPMTELERARQVADRFSDHEFGLPGIVQELWRFLLRGEPVTLKAKSERRGRRAVELWWPDTAGEHRTIGYLVEQEPHEWQLHAVGDELRPIPKAETVEEYIASEARVLLGNPDITAADVREVRRNRTDDKPLDGLPAMLLAYGIDLAYRFELLDRAGDEPQ